MTPPLASVIIPAHNRGGLLRECLESVANQTHPAIEVIVVDDASEQDLRAVVQGIAERFVPEPTLIRLGRNAGPALAREAGRREASGEFLAYLDSDDLWHPRFLELQIRELLLRRDAGMSYCVTREFADSPTRKLCAVRQGSDQRIEQFLPNLLFRRPWSTSSCVWRREATDRIGSWFDCRWEDYEYECRAGCHGVGIAHVPRQLCFYRLSGEQKISKQRGAERNKLIAKGVLEAGRNLERSGWFEDPMVRNRYFTLLYYKGVSLLRAGELVAGVGCLRGIGRLSKWSPFIGGVAGASAGVSRLTGSTLPGRAGCRVLRALSPQP